MAFCTLLLRNSSTYFSASTRTIKFGNCDNGEIKHHSAFVFDFSMLLSLYTSILQILSFFKTESATENKMEKIAINQTKSYFWTSKSLDSVLLINKEGETVLLEIEFNYFQFNEFVHTLYQIIIPAFCLQNAEAEFTHFILEAEICDFVKLSNFQYFKEFVSETSFSSESFKFFTFVNYYLDIFFILHKLKSFCNTSFLPNNLETLLSI